MKSLEGSRQPVARLHRLFQNEYEERTRRKKEREKGAILLKSWNKKSINRKVATTYCLASRSFYLVYPYMKSWQRLISRVVVRRYKDVRQANQSQKRGKNQQTKKTFFSPLSFSFFLSLSLSNLHGRMALLCCITFQHSTVFFIFYREEIDQGRRFVCSFSFAFVFFVNLKVDNNRSSCRIKAKYSLTSPCTPLS